MSVFCTMNVAMVNICLINNLSIFIIIKGSWQRLLKRLRVRNFTHLLYPNALNLIRRVVWMKWNWTESMLPKGENEEEKEKGEKMFYSNDISLIELIISRLLLWTGNDLGWQMSWYRSKRTSIDGITCCVIRKEINPKNSVTSHFKRCIFSCVRVAAALVFVMSRQFFRVEIIAWIDTILCDLFCIIQ